ncbi:hypothetical protein HPB50_028853 [Hyalomma asiaticum]|nr:hypothetical protein HPB50_028853 [Hyalomma asiaticum]
MSQQKSSLQQGSPIWVAIYQVARTGLGFAGDEAHPVPVPEEQALLDIPEVAPAARIAPPEEPAVHAELSREVPPLEQGPLLHVWNSIQSFADVHGMCTLESPAPPDVFNRRGVAGMFGTLLYSKIVAAVVPREVEDDEHDDDDIKADPSDDRIPKHVPASWATTYGIQEPPAAGLNE